MTKLSLDPNPSFVATVKVPIPGDDGGFAPVKFTFKHRDREGLKKFMNLCVDTEEQKAMDPGVMVMEAATAWDLDDKFNLENAQKLVTNYMGAGRAIYEKYIEELGRVRLGN